MARYRLRFLLQEFDLPRGTTVLGRGSECHVTIEDPLVSRQHARIVVEGDDITVSDLGSRNGVRVNAQTIRGPTRLFDGDRIRIGTQELVFCRMEAVRSTVKTTGFLRHCAKCRLPYPEEVATCPNCGGSESLQDDTLTDHMGAEDRASWSLQLLIEVLDKAMSLGRLEDAERVVHRASAQVEERILQGEVLDPGPLAALARRAISLSMAAKDAKWSTWVTQIYRRAGAMPTFEVVTGLGEAGQRFPEVAQGVDELTNHLAARGHGLGDEDGRVLSHLETIRDSLPRVAGAPVLG